ncbi:hypothetical protein M1563_00620 [Patescibacteria group bacterium]|nr:hypothetical protein [Patescibacteria group bacterium]MCL5410121.1 hypothetical protein [Patescibacteria group bacterium]
MTAEYDLPPGLGEWWIKHLLNNLSSVPNLQSKCPFVQDAYCLMQEHVPVCPLSEQAAKQCHLRFLGIDQLVLPILKIRKLAEGDQYFQDILRLWQDKAGND